MKNVDSELLLSNTELEFLVENLRDEGLRHRLEDRKSQGGPARLPSQVSLGLETHEVAVLLQELGDLLAEKGFDETYRPNTTGLLVEGLIDKASRLRWP